ncbi:AfsR/SARP family transcriptional regulator [Streptomyces diastatochromogenes]|nr:AfsR/SARP family transcriptional regulator [Streptomyces diastatochromogenes]
MSITPTAAAPRQLLALLTASADQVVPVTVLTEELWPSGPPHGARAELQAHIAELRTLIEGALRDADPAEPRPGWSDRRGADGILVSQPGGYRLDTGGGPNDVRQFERAAGAGYRAMEAGDLSRAALRLGEALALWRGEPYAGVAAGPGSAGDRAPRNRPAQRPRPVGGGPAGPRPHAELVSELTGLVARYRTNEPLHAHLMVALLRCGQPDEALIAYERLRVNLKSETGMEPSARLRRLQRSVLTARDTPPAPVRPPHPHAVHSGPSGPRPVRHRAVRSRARRLVPAGSVG